MQLRLLILLPILFAVSSARGERVATGDPYQDLKTTFYYLYDGSLKQFQQKNNLYYAAAAAPALWYSFEEDDRISELLRRKKLRGHVNFVGDLGVALNFPFVPIGLYYLARAKKSQHNMQFMMEYISTLGIALIESGVLSFVQIHRRPSEQDLSFWEDSFRGESSFPSGHIIPYAALTFKTLQFYGPWWSLGPLLLTVWSSQQRIQDGKHYLSDVVGSFFLAAFASEGVRASAGYGQNHPWYRWLYESEARLGLIRKGRAFGPNLVFAY